MTVPSNLRQQFLPYPPVLLITVIGERELSATQYRWKWMALEINYICNLAREMTSIWDILSLEHRQIFLKVWTIQFMEQYSFLIFLNKIKKPVCLFFCLSSFILLFFLSPPLVFVFLSFSVSFFLALYMLINLCLSFLIYKIGTLFVLHTVVVRIKYEMFTVVSVTN